MEQQTRNLTYYLGAGASVQAIPTVGERFNEEFILFCWVVTERESNFSNYEALSNFVQEVISSLPKHFSPDTLARKFMFQDINKYVAYKRLLSFFFVFKQTFFKGEPNSHASVELKKKTNKFIDARYDVVFAALLDEQTKKLPATIRFVSWNYDMQLELSYNSFYPHLTIGDCCDRLGTYPTHFNDYTQPSDAKLVKLNGTAGLKRLHTSIRLFDMHSFKEMSYSEFFSIVKKETNNALTSTKNFESYNDAFYFAWDSQSTIEDKGLTDRSIAEGARKRAKEIISETDILVVIGYSFPLYNRKIDLEILSSVKDGAEIYLQLPTEEDTTRLRIDFINFYLLWRKLTEWLDRLLILTNFLYRYLLPYQQDFHLPSI